MVTALHSERVNEHCDKGRPRSTLEEQFPFLKDWGGWDELPEIWTQTVESDRLWVRERVPAFLDWLRSRPEQRIVVVGHGGFFHGLTTAMRLEKGHMRNCEVLHFTL
mmetsp:Transcript_105694/g.192321  ORF Transcript_105694/g.192321 Transcript_105694/m.192321 type:complete len:107 (+) Transcript_105694:2-322(+)